MSVSLAALRKIALALPGVEEGTSYGTAAYRVRKKLMARVREDDVTLVLSSDWDERDNLMETDPDTFFITDHYANHPYVLVDLRKVARATLAELLEGTWRRHASKRMIADFDGNG